MSSFPTRAPRRRAMGLFVAVAACAAAVCSFGAAGASAHALPADTATTCTKAAIALRSRARQGAGDDRHAEQGGLQVRERLGLRVRRPRPREARDRRHVRLQGLGADVDPEEPCRRLQGAGQPGPRLALQGGLRIELGVRCSERITPPPGREEDGRKPPSSRRHLTDRGRDRVSRRSVALRSIVGNRAAEAELRRTDESGTVRTRTKTRSASASSATRRSSSVAGAGSPTSRSRSRSSRSCPAASRRSVRPGTTAGRSRSRSVGRSSPPSS